MAGPKDRLTHTADHPAIVNQRVEGEEVDCATELYPKNLKW
jgi:hypothetical protein